MIDLIKELWYKFQTRRYLKKVKMITELRRKLNAKQRSYKEAAETFEGKFKEVSKL